MDRLLSNYLAFPGEKSATRLVRYATAHSMALCMCNSLDLGILAEAEEVCRAAKLNARLAARRAEANEAIRTCRSPF